jgi:hypothetical protein
VAVGVSVPDEVGCIAGMIFGVELDPLCGHLMWALARRRESCMGSSEQVFALRSCDLGECSLGTDSAGV